MKATQKKKQSKRSMIRATVGIYGNHYTPAFIKELVMKEYGVEVTGSDINRAIGSRFNRVLDSEHALACNAREFLYACGLDVALAKHLIEREKNNVKIRG